MPPVVVDTSALLAFFGASEPDHDAVSAVLATADALIVSPYVVAELDYLIATRHGVDDELAVLDELVGGAWDLAAFDEAGLRRAGGVIASHPDQEIGVADASIWSWRSGTGRAGSPAWTADTSLSSGPSTANPSTCCRGGLDRRADSAHRTEFPGTSTTTLVR